MEPIWINGTYLSVQIGYCKTYLNRQIGSTDPKWFHYKLVPSHPV